MRGGPRECQFPRSRYYILHEVNGVVLPQLAGFCQEAKEAFAHWGPGRRWLPIPLSDCHTRRRRPNSPIAAMPNTATDAGSGTSACTVDSHACTCIVCAGVSVPKLLLNSTKSAKVTLPS